MVDITNEPVYEGPSEDDLCQATEALEGALVRIMAHADWTLDEKTREMELYLAGIQKRARRMIGQKATHLENAYYDIAGAILGALQEGAGALEMRLSQVRQAAALGGDSGAPAAQQGGELSSAGQSGTNQALLREDGSALIGEEATRNLLQAPAPGAVLVATPIPGLPVAPRAQEESGVSVRVAGPLDPTYPRVAAPRLGVSIGLSGEITGGGGGAEFDGTTTPTRPIAPGAIRPNGRRPSASGRDDSSNTTIAIPAPSFANGKDESQPQQLSSSNDIDALCACLKSLAARGAIGAPVDIDTPLAFLFGQRNEQWHAQAAQFYGREFYNILLASSLEELIMLREESE